MLQMISNRHLSTLQQNFTLEDDALAHHLYAENISSQLLCKMNFISGKSTTFPGVQVMRRD